MTTDSATGGAKARAPRRWATWLGLTLLLLLIALVGLRLLLQPERVARFVLARAGTTLGLQITMAGGADYRLRGTPQLVVRDVTARTPGAATPLLHADRILLAVPWSTLRARGTALDAQRLEIDAPRVDLPAVLAWQATRPPSPTRLPTFADGVAIRDGRVDGDGWHLDGIELDMPQLRPDRPVRAHLRARYADVRNTASFNGALAVTRPANGASSALVGDIAFARDDWTVATHATVSAPLDIGNGVRLRPLRAALSGDFVRQQTRQPFVLGAYGPLSWRGATLKWAPLALVTRPRGNVPALQATGALDVAKTLQLQLRGALTQWPDAWPALPPPIGQSASPLPFALAYAGASDFSDPVALDLQRGATRFHARFRIAPLLAWATATPAESSPLPPLQGALSTPRIDISGATLEGVEAELDDDGASP